MRGEMRLVASRREARVCSPIAKARKADCCEDDDGGDWDEDEEEMRTRCDARQCRADDAARNSLLFFVFGASSGRPAIQSRRVGKMRGSRSFLFFVFHFSLRGFSTRFDRCDSRESSLLARLDFGLLRSSFDVLLPARRDSSSFSVFLFFFGSSFFKTC